MEGPGLQCPICTMRCCNAAGFDRHLRFFHGGNYPYYSLCTGCARRGNFTTTRSRRMPTDCLGSVDLECFTCPACHEEFLGAVTLGEKDIFGQCPICKAQLSESESLGEHYESSDKHPPPCASCNTVFATQKDHDAHYQWRMQSSYIEQADPLVALGQKETGSCCVPTKITMSDTASRLTLTGENLHTNSGFSSSSVSLVHPPYRYCFPCKAIVSRGQAHLTSSPNHPNCTVCRLGFENGEQLDWHMIAKNTCNVCAIHHDSPEALHGHRQASIQHKGAEIINRTCSLSNLIIEAVAENIVDKNTCMKQVLDADGVDKHILTQYTAPPVEPTAQCSPDELYTSFPGAYPGTPDEETNGEVGLLVADADALVSCALVLQVSTSSDMVTSDYSDIEDEDDFYDLACEIPRHRSTCKESPTSRSAVSESLRRSSVSGRIAQYPPLGADVEVGRVPPVCHSTLAPQMSRASPIPFPSVPMKVQMSTWGDEDWEMVA
ncbi:hypothetical protein C8Q70DRAFT_987819 [Cubamyces menziesii]|nr:hypothetical protein C8Q70DRAFT_987819 [Cubamyces menziesii]